MLWLIKLLSKAKAVDMTDVLTQQTADDMIRLLKEVLM